MKLPFLLAATFLLISNCNGQPEERFYAVFPKMQYLEDLDSLAAKLVSIHPSPFEFTGEADFNERYQKLRDSVDEDTAFREFIWMCSELVASLNCGHTSLGWFNQEAKILPKKLMFPLEGKVIDGRLYVTDPLVNREVIRPGAEIFSINGVEVTTLVDRIYAHINSQGDNTTYKGLLMSSYLPYYVSYALDFPETFSVVVSGELDPVNLAALSEYRPKPRISPQAACQDNLCLEILKDQQTALLTIRSFAYYGNKFPEYEAFIDRSFAEIESKGIENLIIDVRMNDGGPSYAAMHLLKYLFDSPFRYWSKTAFDDEAVEVYQPHANAFDGKLFVLMDGNCSSTTPHFLSIFKQNRLGVLIGQEANGNHLTFGGQKWLELPNTKIKYCVGRNTYISSATNFDKRRGILPDHHVVQGIGDLLDAKDTVLDYVLEMVGSTGE
ncbi:S41 family peptidase [Neolewinella persica]|uniref:S41 family peptidase n=1 Tax=Neolewinella persica TaxID=70998 RepID=UPI00037A70CD|nr:S41 family peptidase [Neolewinella persica]